MKRRRIEGFAYLVSSAPAWARARRAAVDGAGWALVGIVLMLALGAGFH